MTKSNKVNIKLEVCKNKTSGKLSIKAHFNSNAPNIFKDNDNYSWMPTEDEKDLLSEAYDFMEVDEGYIPDEKNIQKPKETKFTPKPVIEEKLKPTVKIQPTEDWKKPTNLQPKEKTDEPAVFEITNEDIKTNDFDKIIDKKIDDPYAKTDKQTSYEFEAKKKKEDQGFIVEANSEEIEAALKRHTDVDRDETIVEADEQTIIDKVLSQKKKGKWGRH
jgi:hypothetical protein